MKSAKESERLQAPPPGRYLLRVESTSATTATTSGRSMLKIGGSIVQPEEFAGRKWFDNIITDATTLLDANGKETTGGGGFGKVKLRGLGIDVDATDDERPDQEIADAILGLSVWVDGKNEPMLGKDPVTGKYDVKQTILDESGREVLLMKFVVDKYLGSVNPDAKPVVEKPVPVQEAPKVTLKTAAPTAPVVVNGAPTQVASGARPAAPWEIAARQKQAQAKK